MDKVREPSGGSGSDEFSALLSDILLHVKEELAFDISVISRFRDGQGEVMHALGDTRGTGIQVGSRFTLDDSIFYRLSRGREPVWVCDVRSDGDLEHFPVTRHLNMRGYMAVPVFLPDTSLYGVLCGLSRRAKSGVDEEQVRVAQTLASLVGNSIARNERPDELRHLKLERTRRVLHQEPPRIVFQPVVNLQTYQVVGAEALARFDDDSERTPDKWFRDAWDVGLGVDLELKAMEKALEQLPRLPDPVYLAINLSPDAFVSPQLKTFLERRPEPLDNVVLEITEHVTIPDYAPLVAAIRDMRRLSLKVAIDDVGAGYAGLYHMLEIRPDVLKLDISLTQNVQRDPAKQALVSSVVTFASRMDIAIIAEGIETAAEAEALRILGVSYGQGYYFARPHAPPLEVLPGR